MLAPPPWLLLISLLHMLCFSRCKDGASSDSDIILGETPPSKEETVTSLPALPTPAHLKPPSHYGKLVLLLHPAGGSAKWFTPLKEKLAAAFSDEDIRFYVPQTKDTFNISIEQQADDLFYDLRAFAKQHNINLQQQKLVIMGHSQGGPRGLALMYRHWNKLHVQGVICVGSPLGGVEILCVDPKLLPGKAPDILEKIQKFNQGKGVEDMKPGSDFLQGLYEKVAEHKKEVALLAIAGKSKGIVGYPPLIRGLLLGLKMSVEDARKVQKQLFGEDAESDLVISVNSQLGRKIRLAHLPTELNLEDFWNMKTTLVKNVMHDTISHALEDEIAESVGTIPFISTLKLEPAELEVPEVIKAIETFIGKNLLNRDTSLPQPDTQSDKTEAPPASPSPIPAVVQ